MDNANLEKLKVSPGKLVPRFSAAVTDYSVVVGSKTPVLKLTILTSDSGASYIIKGNDGGKVLPIEEGQTIVLHILVSAEDGTTTKTYTIRFNRLSSNDALLSQLELSVGKLVPTFDSFEHNYECYLPSSTESLSMRAKTQDEAMKLSMMDSSSMGTVNLKPGRTLAVIAVKSANEERKTEYIINFYKNPLPPTVQLKKRNERFECAVCCGVVSMSTRIDRGPYVYCRDCLKELTRTYKMDPFTGKKLGEKKWLKMDFRRDDELGAEDGVCPLPFGKVEATLSQMGAKLMSKRKGEADEELTEACKDCSKKIPVEDTDFHKNDGLCTAKKQSVAKQEVKPKVWQKRLVDETIGSNANTLVTSASEFEKKYLLSLPSPGETPHYAPGKAPLDYLLSATRAYATAIANAPKEGHIHLALGIVLEELFYAEDLYGLSQEEPFEEDEGEAQSSSKEEEFLAICKLQGVPPSAPVALQLKAVEVEYQDLKESGQTHKADHVQSLYAWKSKKVLEAGQSSFSVVKESSLYKAKLKYQDAVSINPSDGEAYYHLGRLCLLLGEKSTAKDHLMSAVALKPTLSPARFCLGLALDTSPHAKALLLQGLSRYLTEQQKLYEEKSEPQNEKLDKLHANKFYRSNNTLIFDGFLQLASLSGHGYLSAQSCLLSVTGCIARAHLSHRASTYQRLLWSSLKGRAVLLKMLHKDGASPATSITHCRQLSALISCSGLEPSPLLREMQMEVFQLGVILQPSSSEALCHLGNGQLTQHDSSNESYWLTDAELSFRASIDMEGKAIKTLLIPEKLQKEKWWMERQAHSKPLSGGTAKQPSGGTAKQPSGGSAKQPSGSSAKQPSGGSAKQPSGGSAKQPSKQQPKQQGLAKPTGRGSRGQVGVGTAASKSTGGLGRTQAPSKPGPARGGKSVATLGDLTSKNKAGPSSSTAATRKSSTDPPSTSEKTSPGSAPVSGKQEDPKEEEKEEKEEINKTSYLPRLGLARTLARTTNAKKREESQTLYQEVMTMNPDFHDAYIELGEMLSSTKPNEAVEVYANFPFCSPPSFDDAFLHGEIIRLVMKSGKYDNPHLIPSMIAMGKALGIGVLDKQVAILEGKFMSSILKTVYAGVHDKDVDDPELEAFFKFKCWL